MTVSAAGRGAAAAARRRTNSPRTRSGKVAGWSRTGPVHILLRTAGQARSRAFRRAVLVSSAPMAADEGRDEVASHASSACAVSETLARLAAAYPDAGCSLEHSVAARAPRLHHPLGPVHRRARQQGDARSSSRASRTPPPSRAPRGSAREAHPVDRLLQREGEARSAAPRRRSSRSTAARSPGRWTSSTRCPASAARPRTSSSGTSSARRTASSSTRTSAASPAGSAGRATTDPEKVERDLNERIPRERWVWISHALILHGRRVCASRKPRCGDCSLADLCPKRGVARVNPGPARLPRSDLRLDVLRKVGGADPPPDPRQDRPPARAGLQAEARRPLLGGRGRLPRRAAPDRARRRRARRRCSTRTDARTEVVGIDEAQFFDAGIVEVATRLADLGKRVIVAGLDQDYLGKPFDPMPALMAEAEEVTKTRAICVRCGAPASRTQRLVESTRARRRRRRRPLRSPLPAVLRGRSRLGRGEPSVRLRRRPAGGLRVADPSRLGDFLSAFVNCPVRFAVQIPRTPHSRGPNTGLHETLCSRITGYFAIV